MTLSLDELIAIVVRRRGWIATATLSGVLLLGVLYAIVPASYEVNTRVYEPSRGAFARLVAGLPDGIFPYRQDEILSEYWAILSDAELLAQAANEAGLVAAPLDSEAMRTFLRRVTVAAPTTTDPYISFIARHGNRDGLDRFVMLALRRANNTLIASTIHQIETRIASVSSTNELELAKVEVSIAAAMAEANSRRLDTVAVIDEQMSVASALGLSNPLMMQRDGDVGVQVMVTPGTLPKYAEGTVALTQQRQALVDRRDNAPFARDLRELEREKYRLENDPTALRIEKSLRGSALVLSEPQWVIRTDQLRLLSEKVFPKIPVFVALGLFLGFVAGLIIAIGREMRVMDRNRA